MVAAAGVATLRYLREHGLIERCAAVAPAFHARLAALRELPAVGDVRGRGLLAGVEFVADAATRAPFPRAAHFAETFAATALEAGLVVWPNVGQADGTNGDIAGPGVRVASTSNRNFMGRQGPGARTHLLSPAMAAAAAVTGRLTDVRLLLAGGGAS